MRLILCDPQTSGGLLMAVHPENKARLLAALMGEKEVLIAAEIGEVVEGPGGIEVVD